MSKLTDAIVGKKDLYAGSGSAVPNLKYGGQNGYMPKLGTIGPDGKVSSEWINNQAYVQKNIIPILIRPPLFLQHMENSEKWIEAYKAIIELHPSAITGLSSGLVVTTDETEIGGGGEFQEEYTDVKRTRSALNMAYKEKANKAITKFFDIIIRYGMMDPDTKAPVIAKFLESIDDIDGMYTPDFYTASILYIEPDITNKAVVDAWFCTNVFPKSSGDRTGKRDVKAAGETVEHSIDFASITLNNDSVIQFAATILKSLTVFNKIPDVDLIAPENEIDSSLENDVGFNS